MRVLCSFYVCTVCVCADEDRKSTLGTSPVAVCLILGLKLKQWCSEVCLSVCLWVPNTRSSRLHLNSFTNWAHIKCDPTTDRWTNPKHTLLWKSHRPGHFTFHVTSDKASAWTSGLQGMRGDRPVHSTGPALSERDNSALELGGGSCSHTRAHQKPPPCAQLEIWARHGGAWLYRNHKSSHQLRLPSESLPQNK